MTIETRWWWVRHAPVTTDGGNIYGQTDLPGDTSNRAVYEGLAAVLPAGGVWVASALQRTQQTAAAVHEVRGDTPDMRHLPEFNEQHFGEWQGQNRQSVFEQHAPAHRFWLAEADFAPAGGESFADLMVRVTAMIDEMTAAHPGEDIVAFAHGGTIRAALGHALGLAPAQSLGFRIDNCSITRLDHLTLDGGATAWRVAHVNWNTAPA